MKAVCGVYPGAGGYSIMWAIQVCSARKVWFLAVLIMAMSQIGFCTLVLVNLALTSTIKLEVTYRTLCSAYCNSCIQKCLQQRSRSVQGICDIIILLGVNGLDVYIQKFIQNLLRKFAIISERKF